MIPRIAKATVTATKTATALVDRWASVTAI